MKWITQLLQGGKEKQKRVDLKKRFELVSQMGLGTMSKVWKAKDRELSRIVALKLIDVEALEKMNARFPGLNRPQEGEVGMSLRHPQFVKTFDYGLSTKKEPFIVMEYIEGHGLQQFIETQNEVLQRCRLQWIISMGEALHYFHERGYIHRDFCPKNVLVTNEEKIKLIDFGLAVPNTPPFQKPGNRTGTADYMAPELVRRQRTDQRIDVYSYAVTCYQMYANRLPYPPGKTLQIIVKNLNQEPKDIREVAPDIDGPVAEIIMKGLAKDPGSRWQTAREMASEFRNVSANS